TSYRTHPTFLLCLRAPLRFTLFPYTTLFRSLRASDAGSGASRGRQGIRRVVADRRRRPATAHVLDNPPQLCGAADRSGNAGFLRSEEHTSELQSPYDLVCRLLLEKKKKHNLRGPRLPRRRARGPRPRARSPRATADRLDRALPAPGPAHRRRDGALRVPASATAAS